MIVYPVTEDHNIQMAQWLANQLDESLDSFGFDRNGKPMFSTMGFSRDNELMCVVIGYHRTETNIIWAFAATSPRWASKENIAAAGAWVFDQLGCERVTSMVLKKNKRSRKFQEGIGFQVEGKLVNGCRDGDVLIYGLLKDDFNKWLRKAFNGQQKRRTADTGT